MSLRKVFSIIISSIAFYLFINMFFPYNGLLNKMNDIAIIDGNMWSFSAGFSIFAIISIISIITIYLLNMFGILSDKWISYANYGVGYLTIFHICFFFLVLDKAKIGIWLGFFFSIALLSLSIVWNFISDEPFSKKSKAPIKGYDPKTGKPIYAKPKGYDPETGKPIYEE